MRRLAAGALMLVSSVAALGVLFGAVIGFAGSTVSVARQLRRV